MKPAGGDQPSLRLAVEPRGNGLDVRRSLRARVGGLKLRLKEKTERLRIRHAEAAYRKQTSNEPQTGAFVGALNLSPSPPPPVSHVRTPCAAGRSEYVTENGKGQVVGKCEERGKDTSLTSGQNTPTLPHVCRIADALPVGQKYPAVQLPTQVADVPPGAPP